MTRQTWVVRAGLVGVVLVNLSSLFVGPVGDRGQPPAAPSPYAKALQNLAPADRQALENSQVYKDLKQALPKADIDGQTFYFPEGDLRLDDDGLLFYAQERALIRQRWDLAQKGMLPIGGTPPTQITLGTWQGQPSRWLPGVTLK